MGIIIIWLLVLFLTRNTLVVFGFMVAVQFTVAGKSGIYGFSNSTDKVVGGAGINIFKKSVNMISKEHKKPGF